MSDDRWSAITWKEGLVVHAGDRLVVAVGSDVDEQEMAGLAERFRVRLPDVEVTVVNAVGLAVIRAGELGVEAPGEDWTVTCGVHGQLARFVDNVQGHRSVAVLLARHARDAQCPGHTWTGRAPAFPVADLPAARRPRPPRPGSVS